MVYRKLAWFQIVDRLCLDPILVVWHDNLDFSNWLSRSVILIREPQNQGRCFQFVRTRTKHARMVVAGEIQWTIELRLKLGQSRRQTVQSWGNACCNGKLLLTITMGCTRSPFSGGFRCCAFCTGPVNPDVILLRNLIGRLLSTPANPTFTDLRLVDD